MCASTRFPEAIPLRNIKTKTIVKALVKFFTLVGLPKSVQSDQGSNFMSGTFQQVMHELGIKQYKSSAYHPESQGALERFHQTLKNMIRSYCFDTEKDWDEGIHLLLFAVRESVQESLGFSPFELVFGHTVRGPLKLMKEKFLSSNDSPFLASCLLRGPPGSNWCFSFAPELVGYSAPRDLHRRAAYSICESWFLIHQDVYHDLFVCS